MNVRSRSRDSANVHALWCPHRVARSGSGSGWVRAGATTPKSQVFQFLSHPLTGVTVTFLVTLVCSGACALTANKKTPEETRSCSRDDRRIAPDHNRRRIPVASDEKSLSVGPDGLLLLQDHYLIEQMAMFNRERIPERQPHAKGGGAFGTFEVTQDVSAYTRAAVFQPGTRTEMLARFSTVADEQGSPIPSTRRTPTVVRRRPDPHRRRRPLVRRRRDGAQSLHAARR